MTISTEDLTSLVDHINQLVPGPWAYESCGEKGDGAYMVGIVCREDDPALAPLSGRLPDFDEAGKEIVYYRDELIAEVDFHNRGASVIAALLALAPTLAAEVLALRSRFTALEAELAEARKDRDESCLALGREIEALRADVTAADARAEKAEKALAAIRAITDAWPSSADHGDLADMLRRIAILSETPTGTEKKD